MPLRLGTEDKKKRTIAMVLVAVALTLIAHMVWQLASGSSSAPPPPVPASSANQQTASTANTSTSGHAALHLESASALDPTLHPEIMALAENTRYTGTSRNIFSKDSLPPSAQIEQPIASVRTGGPAVSGGPPPPPPIDLKFYGFAKPATGRKLVFLMDGEDIFVAGQGDIVDGRYKIVQVESTAVVIEDLAYNNEQTIPLQTM